MAWFSKKNDHYNNRLNFILAIVFLLTFSLIAKLFFIQIKNHDYYLNAASSQHEIYAELEPERGKIFIQDNKDLYPMATNKTFVQIYAVPKNLKESELVAEKLYEFFHQEEVLKEADELLAKQDLQRLDQELAYIQTLNLNPEELAVKEIEVRQQHKDLLKDPTYLELRELKKEQIIKNRHNDITQKYLEKLNKWNDPYESLQKKVEPELAKQFHLSLQDSWTSQKDETITWSSQDLSLDDLKFKSYGLYYTPKEEYLKFPGIGYMPENYRYYLEDNIGSHILGFVSYEKSTQNGLFGKHGSYGLEGFFDEELFGQYGSVKGERGAGGLMIASNREYIDKQDGADLILTIDRSIQFYACNKLSEMAKHFSADSGTVIVMEPQTGAIIAMCSYPDFNPNDYNQVENIQIFNNPALFDQYEPGSVFKAITMAAALNENKVTPTTTYYDEGQVMISGWPKPIKNSDFETKGGHGTSTMVEVLEKSLNTGVIYTVNLLEPKVFADYVKKFGFGEKTGIELAGEFPGNIRSLTGKKISEISLATASFGQGITVTPLQMATAYAAIANGGYLVKPYIVKEMVNSDGSKLTTKPLHLQRVISEHTASILSGMLASVVENGHATGAQVPGYFIAGKTGTAQIAAQGKKGYDKNQYNHTFTAFAPANNPRFVILTKFGNPKGYAYSSSTALPLANDITEFILKYWQVPIEKRLD